MNEQVYISDTNIWIDLQNAGLLDKLFNLPFLISCTDFVLNELTGFDHQHLIDMGLVIEALDEQATASLIGLMRSHNNSSVADVSCFQLASETGRPLLTGDRPHTSTVEWAASSWRTLAFRPNACSSSHHSS
jgi:hypothetical protein